MNFAEGKGPKQVKRTWPLGKFVTVYGNGVQSNVNPAPVPYPAAFSGSAVGNLTTSGAVIYTQPGSVVPGLVLNSSVNSGTDVGFVCSPGSIESIQDLESTGFTLYPMTGWSGSCVVTLQGSADRHYENTKYTSTAWRNIVSATVTTANTTYAVSSGQAWPVYNAYRLVASGGSGIINWSIAGMFTDYSAMGIGANAGDANGGIGQLQLQNVRNLTLSGGNITVNQGADPYENIKANHTYIG